MSQSIIVEKLKKTLLIAVEFDGYHGDDPIEAYDAFANCGLLQNFDAFENQINEASKQNSNISHHLKKVREQIELINIELANYAKKLNQSAAISDTDVTKVNDKVFEGLTRQFEMRKKHLLRIVSPAPWLG